MARYRLTEDHYRDGRYYRAGEYLVLEKGDVPPPRSSKRVKDAAPVEEEIDDELVEPKGAQDLVDGGKANDKSKGGKANDKSPI